MIKLRPVCVSSASAVWDPAPGSRAICLEISWFPVPGYRPTAKVARICPYCFPAVLWKDLHKTMMIKKNQKNRSSLIRFYNNWSKYHSLSQCKIREIIDNNDIQWGRRQRDILHLHKKQSYFFINNCQSLVIMSWVFSVDCFCF